MAGIGKSLLLLMLAGCAGDRGRTLRAVEVVPVDATVRSLGAVPDGAWLMDVRGRFLLEGTATGSVRGWDPETRQLIWAWPDLGVETTGLAASPEGDRVYQAVGGDAPSLVTRDLQTGRVLGSTGLVAPLEWLVAGDDGMLFGVAGGAVIALSPRRGRIEPVWRRAVGGEGMRVAAQGGRVAVWGGRDMGLRLLDAATGEPIGWNPAPPLDVALEEGGVLWVLYEGEMRRLE